MFDNWPPPFVIALVATVAWATVVGVIGLPLARAWAKRLEQRKAPAPPADLSARLERIEAAVDSIALEVERISESQRFLTKLQSERMPIAPGAAPIDRQR